MGVLDDAIRDHLDLKRRHGATEQELERQEAEALGPARRDPGVDTEAGADAVGPTQEEQPAVSAEDSPALFDQTADSDAFEREADPSAAAEEPPAADAEGDADDLARAVGVAEDEPPVDEVPPGEALEGAEDSAPSEAAKSADDPGSAPATPEAGEPRAGGDEGVVAVDPPPPAASETPAPEGGAEAQSDPEAEDTDELLIEYDEGLLSDDELLEEDEELMDEDEDLIEGQPQTAAAAPPTGEDAPADEPAGDVEVVEGGLAEEGLTREELAEEGLAGDDVLEETPDFLQETPEDERLWFEQQPPRDFDLDR